MTHPAAACTDPHLLCPLHDHPFYPQHAIHQTTVPAVDSPRRGDGAPPTQEPAMSAFDHLSPRTRTALDAADRANQNGDKATTHQLIRDAYANGTDADRLILDAAAFDVVTRNR